MKKITFVLLVTAMLIFLPTGCQNTAAKDHTGTKGNQTEETEEHKIGVAVYDVTDEEVIAFREYLQGYIEECFPEVTFYYSYSIRSKEDEMQFLEEACNMGAEGVMSFITYDLPAEVEYCASQGVYYMMASGTVAEESFRTVADNPYFLGVIGGGNEIEYQAGADMAEYFIQEQAGDSYLLFTGGAGIGNEMHRMRSIGALDAFAKAYGDLGENSEELALAEEPRTLLVGNVRLTIFPGYTSREEVRDAAAKALETAEYDNVLAMFSVYSLAEELKAADVRLGVIDSYNQTNQQLFADRILYYVTGKFNSTIGPSFAAMYNAVTGYAKDFRDNGKAFSLTQGFWTSDNATDYNEKYALATGIYVNAYNYDDLDSVMKIYDETASFEKLKALTEAYTYEDAKSRRNP